MTDYKNYKPKFNWLPVVEGVCFVLSVIMLAFTYVLLVA
jgi:hypothetical protein